MSVATDFRLGTPMDAHVSEPPLRRNVLGIQIAAVDRDRAVRVILDAARARRSLAVSALAVHGVMTGAFDRVHQYRLNRFDLLVPDGQPVRWALRWLHGVRLSDRVRGADLMAGVCARAAAERVPIFLFGGTEDLLAELRERLRRDFPGLVIAGARASRFRRLSASERDALLREIRESGAAVTFVGIGCPRQEIWAFEHAGTLSMPVIAIGAAFDFLAGRKAQAPTVMQECGLEWLHRLMQEPTRLWRRYLLLNPSYLALLALQKAGLRRCDPDAGRPPREELRYG